MTSQNISIYSNFDEKNKRFISIHDGSPKKSDSVSINNEFKVSNIANIAN